MSTDEPLPKRKCEWCGVKFRPKRAGHRFCSTRCREKDYRKRHPTTAPHKPFPCPRKGNPKARDPELAVDCPNMVIPSKAGPRKYFCSRKCAKAVYRENKSDHLAQLKKDWWGNLSDAEKAEHKKRVSKWQEDNRLKLNAQAKARRDALPPEKIEVLHERNRQWRAKQAAKLAEAQRILESATITARGATAKPKRRTKDTTARITVAAYLHLQRESFWDMGPYLYPKQNIRDNAYKSVCKLFKDYRTDIDTEWSRLGQLAVAIQKAEAGAALSVYHPTAKLPFPT